jgi:phage terminase small subunit
MLDDTGKLSVRQEKFVEHYALCGNAAEAARLAGYSARTARVIGPENLTKPAVKAALAARQQAFQEELKVTKDDVLTGILNAIQLAKEQQNPAAMISGLAQIAKLCGFYEPDVSRIEISGEALRLKQQFAAMSDDELLAVIACH